MSTVSAVNTALVNAPDTRAPTEIASSEQSDFAATLRTKTVGEVAPEHTPLSGSQATTALAQAWRARFGQDPSPKTLAILGSQWSLETGGGKAMMNYNFGGIKGRGPSGLSVNYKTVEGSGASEKHIVDRFRAYSSAAEGASDYIHLLEKRFPGALQKAQAGDPSGFVHQLKQAGYFTGSEVAYTNIVTDLSGRAERNGFDALGKGGSVSVSKAPEPVAPSVNAAPSRTPDMQAELLRLSHALDEAALGIMDAKTPSGSSSNDWLSEALSDTRHTSYQSLLTSSLEETGKTR